METLCVTRVDNHSMSWTCIVLLLLSVALPSPLLADIQGGKLLKQPQGAVKQPQRDSGVLVVPPIRAQVSRGKSIDIPILVTPSSDSVRVKIIAGPQHGTLVRIENRPGAVAVYRYRHDKESQDPDDAFTILIADRFSEYGSRQTARIQISNPQPIVEAKPGGPLDFGKTPVDSASTNELTLSNTFGATVSGTLKVAPPWRIEGDPELSLPEGSSQTIRITFAPNSDGANASLLTLDPPMANFPEVLLRGEGIAPFGVIGPLRVELTKESPVSAYTLTNTTENSLEINLSGLPKGIDSPAIVSIAPHGTGEISLSAAHLEIPPDHYEKHGLMLASGSYRKQVELVIKGPKAPPSMELLNARDGHGTRLGVPLVIEGVVRNPSPEKRSLEVVLGEFGKAISSATNLLTLPAQGVTNFQLHWSPSQVGQGTLSIELREQGIVIDRQAWSVSVKSELLPVQSPDDPVLKQVKDRPKGPSLHIVGNEEASTYVIGLHPLVEKGFLMNQFSLSWQYFGSEKTRFQIQRPRHRNTLTDRTGQMGDIYQAQSEWETIKDVTIISKGSNWSARLPFLMPGMQTFRVIPDKGGEVKYAETTFPLDRSMVIGPPIRAILILLLILLVFRVMMQRF